MLNRLRNLSRSRRGDSPAGSGSVGPDHSCKPSESSIATRDSPADIPIVSSSAQYGAPLDPLGLSILHAPDEPPAVDLIFVHGLGGASIKTWCKGYDRSLLWPKYWLPDDLGSTKVRVLTFGYNADVLSKTKTQANISDFAKSLLAALKYEKNDKMEDLGIGRVPIVFIAHSMGGLVVKKAYLRGRYDKEYEAIVSQIRAIVFLSTPHRGSSLAITLDRILSISLTPQAKKVYITELAKNSSTIEELNEDFRHQASSLELYSFYELNSTVMKGLHSVMIVPKESAILGYPTEKSLPLAADHHDVCKYSDPGDANYRSVVSVLKTVVSRLIEEAFELSVDSDRESMRKIESLLAINCNPEEDLSALRDRWAPGTCQNLLKDKSIAAWLRERTSAGVLWMHANPGSGKSIKAAFLIDHLRAAGFSCQYFFFRHDDTIKRSANVFFRSLVYQVAGAMPTFRTALIKLVDGRSYGSKIESRYLWKTLFEAILFSIKFEKPVYWIVDAIDEADSLTTIITSLSRVPRDLPIRIILLSRHLLSVPAGFSHNSEAIPITAVAIDDNHKDIRRFVQREVAFLPGDHTFHCSVVEQLVQRSENNFLWVHLALQDLQGLHSHESLDQVLQEIPRGMDSMYERMEAAIGQLPHTTDKALARMLLLWATYGKRPLQVKEMLRILKPHFPPFLDLRSSIYKVCGHFITVDTSDRICLVHATARDYLRHASKLPFSLEPRSSHEEAFNMTLQILIDPQLRTRISQKEMPPFCEYAVTSWAYHLGRSSSDSDNVLSILAKFFNGHFVLPWIEALAILLQLSSLIFASAVVTTFIQRRRKSNSGRNPLQYHSSDLRSLEIWALDLVKVVGKFGNYLTQDPASIYKFIPQLCPLNSAIHQQSGSSSLSQISVSGLFTADWDDLLSRLSAGTSNQASLLCCSGGYLAVSTSAKTIIVWNAVSFEKLLTLKHDEHIFNICFNESGNKLMSYASRTTKVWDLAHGHVELSIANPRNIKSLAMRFVENDTAVLMCSDARRFSKLFLHDSFKGWQTICEDVFKAETTLKNAFTTTPASIDFNGDGSQIAVAYRGAPLEIWDLMSSRLVKRCRRILSSGSKLQQWWTGVNRVQWHPIDYEVLGLYTDGAVFKWQPLTETHEELPDSSDSSPFDICIAPNGNVFLTSDANGSIKIYDYHDFTHVYQLSSEDIITAVCFSPDSQRFYDIRGSYCNVWQPNALIRLAEAGDQDSDIESDVKSLSNISTLASDTRVDTSVPTTSLVANAKGSLICGGDDEGTITLYDISNSTKLQIAASVPGMGIERIAWSRDGDLLAYEDLARRLVVFSIQERKTSSSSFSWIVDRLLDIKSTREHDLKMELLILSNPTRLLFAGTKLVQCCHLDSPTSSTTLDLSSNIAAFAAHPQDSSRLLTFGEGYVEAFDMSTGSPHHRNIWRMAPPSTADCDQISMDRITTSPDGEYLLLLYSQHNPQHQNMASRKIRLIQSSALNPSAEQITTFKLPQSIESLVEQPLNIIGSSLFVFIDKSFWINTWRFSVQDLLEDTETPPDDIVPIEGLQLEDSGTTTSLGLKRHFFLPRDWINASNLALCTVLADGTFLCPRKGEVAVIRSGLESE